MTFAEWYERQNIGHTDEAKEELRKCWEDAYEQGVKDGKKSAAPRTYTGWPGD